VSALAEAVHSRGSALCAGALLGADLHEGAAMTAPRFIDMTPAELDKRIKQIRKRRGWFGRDLRIDPCPKCSDGEMLYQLMASSHIFICDRCDWIDWKR
jgi:hypothetical protein